MNVDIYQGMPYSMTYSDDSMIASYGNYISKQAANEAAIKAVREWRKNQWSNTILHSYRL